MVNPVMDILAQPIEIETNVDGAIASGALFISVKNVGTAIATVNGVNLSPREAKSYSFVGKAYVAIHYVTNGSILRIMTIR
jgi:hypothetical protein